MHFNNSENDDATANDDNKCPAGLSSQANKSSRQSLYVAALDRYLGIRGLISPVRDTANGLHYDFLHVETKRLIKVFTSVVREELFQYADAHLEERTLFIIDTENVANWMSAGYLVTIEDDDELVYIATKMDSLIYHDGRLWKVSEEEDSEKRWERLEPFVSSRSINKLRDLDH